jgi:hypothetical protein
MKIKTSELTGAALDWAVAQCEGATDIWQALNGEWCIEINGNNEYFDDYRYSRRWSDGGPIIEEQEICINSQPLLAHPWVATIYGSAQASGSSPLIAAMRCYVASRLGDEVDVPDELLINTPNEVGV